MLCPESRIGSHIAIDMHMRMPGSLTLVEAHQIVSSAEKRLRERFGQGTFISIHMEPVKEKSLPPKHSLTPLPLSKGEGSEMLDKQ